MAILTEDKKLNGSGLSVLWGLIKNLIPTKTSDITNDSNYVADANYVHTDNNYTTTEKTKLSGIDNGAEVNTIETIKINNVAATITNKEVNIPVPTNNNQLSNGAGYQNESQVNALIDSKMQAFIIPKGSVAYASLPTPSSSNLGWMWNMTDSFTIDNRFVEYESGKTKTYPAGTNVYVIDAGTGGSHSYKFDIFTGFVDMSGYATKEDVEALTTAEIEAICV